MLVFLVALWYTSCIKLQGERQPMLEKNQLISVEIVAMSHEGEGIARHNNMAVFIPMTAVGDKLTAKVVKVLKNRAYAIVTELSSPSDKRCEDDCPVYRRCGGCSLRHVQYSHELVVKNGWVGDNLKRIGGVDIPLEPIIASPSYERYRNKAQYPVRLVDGKVQVGFFSRRSHAVVPVEDCLLQPAVFGEIAKALVRYMESCGVAPYDEETQRGIVRHLYIRLGEKTGQIMVCVVINARKLPREELLLAQLREVCPDLETLVVNINQENTNVILGKETIVLHGRGYIEDELAGIRVRISPASFYQVNRSAAELLYRAAREYAQPSKEDTVLDLYCGAGTIGLSMADVAGQVVGVEVVPQAVEDAKRNARLNGIQNARFFQGDAADAAARLAEEGLRPNIVLLDPPRKGVTEALIVEVVGMQPDKVVYISCNSATLARDVKIFAQQGYMVKKARAADLFPRTAHVESVVLLVRCRE